MDKAEMISEIKKNFDSIYKKDRSYVGISEKQMVVKMGSSLYICDVGGDPDLCELSSKIEDACDDTIEKVLKSVTQEAKMVKDYMKDKNQDDINPFIPGGPPDRVTSERQQEIDDANQFVGDCGTSEGDLEDDSGDENPFIP